MTIPRDLAVTSSYWWGNTGPFANCSALADVTIAEGVTKLPQYLFAGSGVKNISWPSTLTEIGPYAFQAARPLRAITLPEGVTTIGTGAFSSCTKLTSITLPDSLTTLGTSVFSSCTALTTIPELPSTLTTLPEWTFSSCTGLTEVTVPESDHLARRRRVRLLLEPDLGHRARRPGGPLRLLLQQLW